MPLLAELVAVLAGASPLGWGRALGASLLGSLPPAVLYAVAGATARATGNGLLVFGLVLALSGVLWVVGRRDVIPSGSDG